MGFRMKGFTRPGKQSQFASESGHSFVVLPIKHADCPSFFQVPSGKLT